MQKDDRTKAWHAVAGVLLCILAILGLTRSVRASAAFLLYHQAKYGTGAQDVRHILTRAERAYALYPYNYFFSILAVDAAFYQALEREEPDRSRLMSSAEHWSGVGLWQNPFHVSLRLLETRLLERRSPALAAAFWASYVDWHFWEPFHHALLVELYARAGDVEKAAASLVWLENTPFYQDAARHLQEAWRREMRSP